MASVIKGEEAASPPSGAINETASMALPAHPAGTVSPAPVSRAATHRPSPITLPPKRLSDYEEFERRSHSGGSRGHLTPQTTTLVERKRSFPADTEARSSDDDDVPKSARLGPMGTPSAADVPPSDMICFCVKAPKVPRPRNAFILYRQHYQAEVVAKNPRLANPDISKIIGGMWKKQSDESREYWKNLAEQEKQHHRKQHPDYRYQPRRASKGDARNGMRPGSATGDGGFEKARGSGPGDSTGDPNRCEKCGGRYIAPLPSARAVPGSARSVHPPPLPYGPVRRSSMPLSAFPSEADDHFGRAYPSPKLFKHVPNAQGPQQHGDQPGRRPLPQDVRPGSAGMMPPRSSPLGNDDGDDYGPRDPSVPPDQKRRRYDLPNLYTARPDADGCSAGTPIHGQPPHRALYRPQHHPGLSPPPPASALAQCANAGLGPGPGPSSGPSPGSPWMAPPPVPYRRYATQPAPQRQNSPADYGGMPGRLPPLQEHSYGYYPGPQSATSAQATPVTAMATLSMRQPLTPAASTPYSARPPMSAVGGGNDQAGSRRGHYPTRPSEFPKESLRLPPLMTNAPQQQQLQHHQNRQQPPESAHPGRMQPMALTRELALKVRGLSDPGHMSDMQRYAVTPTPVLERFQDTPDRASQASGIRAMVLSIPYLVRLESLRRMNPPLSMATRRGPVIAVEGHNRALTDEVSRVVELALRQSGECHVGVWSTSTPTKKQSTDSGIGNSIDGSMGGQGKEEEEEDEIDEADALAEYQALVMSWREKTKAIVRHVNSADGATAPAPSVEKEDGDAASSALVRAPSSTSTRSSPAQSLPSEAADEDDGDCKPCASTAASPQQADQLVPVALISGGYSLSLADRYTMTVPIEDGYSPLDHWEWMASMWRATAAPDLVLYVDCEPSTASDAQAESSVDTQAKEGVIVLHASKAAAAMRASAADAAGGDGSKDWMDNSVLDKKTERRLTFEVMEWVRAFGSGA